MLLPISCATVSLNTPINTIAKDYVLFLLLSGSISMCCNDTQFVLRAQDVVIINPGMDFSASTETNNVLIRMEIGASFLAETYQTSDFSIRCNSVLYPGDHTALVRQIMALAREKMEDCASGWTPKACACAFGLLDTIRRDYCDMFTPDRFESDIDGQQDESARKEQIRRYLQMHYQDPISLTSLADYVHLTPQYLSKFFKKQFGTGFLKYLTQLRLTNAYIDLSETDKSVTKIAMDCGFSNLSSFNKSFQEKYGMSPKEFRSSISSKVTQDHFTVLTDQETESYLHLPDFSISEDVVQVLPENITVSVDVPACTLQPYTKSWEEIINLGNAENCLLHGLREQLGWLTKKVRFKYARMDHIFNEHLLFLSEHDELVGLNTFAEIINLLRTANLTPFLAMEMTPAALAAETSSYAFMEKQGEIYNDRQWKLLFEQFMRYCMNAWGEDTVEQWCFELTLPKLSTDAPFHCEQKWAEQYARRLRITEDIVHRYVPRAKVGGPGISLDSANAPHFEILLQEITKQKMVPDFISACLYPTYVIQADHEQGHALSIVYPCDENAAGRIRQAQDVVRSIFTKQIPFYITEFGCDRTNKCYINDTVYASAFIAKTVVDTFSFVDGLGYCNLTDTTNGKRKSNRLLFGGRGMLTQESIKKSTFYAYWLMSKLGERLVQRGQNYMVSSRRPDCYELLVHNFKGLNEAFCRNYFQNTHVHFHYESALEDVRSMNFHIDLDNLKQGKYRVKYYFLNREHGDLEKAVNDVFTYANIDMRQEELEYLSNICLPQQTLMMATVLDGHLPLDLYLSPNEICLIAVIFHSS